jgi:hypothetical protein
MATLEDIHGFLAFEADDGKVLSYLAQVRAIFQDDDHIPIRAFVTLAAFIGTLMELRTHDWTPYPDEAERSKVALMDATIDECLAALDRFSEIAFGGWLTDMLSGAPRGRHPSPANRPAQRGRSA